jgi:hypothetical protein
MKIETGMKLPVLVTVVHSCWPLDHIRKEPFALYENSLVLLMDVTEKEKNALNIQLLTANGRVCMFVWRTDPNRNFKLVK